MKIVFVGAVDFSLHCLREVLRNGGDIRGVLTIRAEQAGIHSDYVDMGPEARNQGIPVHYIKSINDPETVQLLKDLKPDVIFVFGFSQMIKKEVLDIPVLGCIGTHPALLPRNRGRHPLIWALVEGLTESGLTFFFLDEGADSGDILWQKPFPITMEDNAGSLYKKIKELASDAIAEFLPQLEDGTYPRKPQDHSLATYWKKRGEKDGLVDWSKPTMIIFNLLRALTHPYVGAHTYLEDYRITIWSGRFPKGNSEIEEKKRGQPGLVLSADENNFVVETGDGALEITEYQSPSGTRISKGNVLGSVEK